MSGTALKISLQILASIAVPVIINLIHKAIKASKEQALTNRGLESGSREVSQPGSKEKCDICNNRISNYESFKLPCSHTFHRDCLRLVFEEELLHKRSCPTRDCRLTFPESAIRAVFQVM